MSTEDLERLATEAEPPPPGAADTGAAPGDVGPVVSPTLVGNRNAIGFLFAAFREVASIVMRVDSLKRTLCDDNIGKIADALVPVVEKYQIDLCGLEAGPEVQAAIVAGPLIWTACRELTAELKARRLPPTDPAAPTPAHVQPAE